MTNLISLQDIAKINLGLNLSQSKESNNLPKNHHYKILSLKNFNQSVCLKEHYITENLSRAVPLDKKFIIHSNDILVKLVAPISAIFIQNAPPNLIYTHFIAKISLTSKIFEPEFLAFYIHYAMSIRKQLMANTLQSTAVALIKLSDLSKITIPLIALSKQNKLINTLKAIERKNEIFRSLILQNQAFSKAILDTFTTDEKFANSTHKDTL